MRSATKAKLISHDRSSTNRPRELETLQGRIGEAGRGGREPGSPGLLSSQATGQVPACMVGWPPAPPV